MSMFLFASNFTSKPSLAIALSLVGAISGLTGAANAQDKIQVTNPAAAVAAQALPTEYSAFFAAARANRARLDLLLADASLCATPEAEASFMAHPALSPQPFEITLQDGTKQIAIPMMEKQRPPLKTEKTAADKTANDSSDTNTLSPANASRGLLRLLVIQDSGYKIEHVRMSFGANASGQMNLRFTRWAKNSSEPTPAMSGGTLPKPTALPTVTSDVTSLTAVPVSALVSTLATADQGVCKLKDFLSSKRVWNHRRGFGQRQGLNQPQGPQSPQGTLQPHGPRSNGSAVVPAPSTGAGQK